MRGTATCLGQGLRSRANVLSALLACAVSAGVLLLLTDVEAVIDGFGTPDARPVSQATPGQLRARSLPARSMGPKVDAACRLAGATGRQAAVGRLDDAAALLAGQAGTTVVRGKSCHLLSLSPARDSTDLGQSARTTSAGHEAYPALAMATEPRD
ncbi:MAG: hypothetical protein ACLQFR_22315 [Streptosporangiaceae bacterium]